MNKSTYLNSFSREIAFQQLFEDCKAAFISCLILRQNMVTPFLLYLIMYICALQYSSDTIKYQTV